jgi:hypothetical protein
VPTFARRATAPRGPELRQHAGQRLTDGDIITGSCSGWAKPDACAHYIRHSADRSADTTILALQ